MENQYYRVKEGRVEYLGERYFRFNNHSEKVVQICLTCGDIKKGKSNNFGIYLISKLTLFSNYMAMNYLEPCTKKQFDKQFEKVAFMLK